jgi:hypothetical protein
VWHLLKSLYGLKQALLVWNQTIDGHLCTSGLEPTEADLCIYIQWKQDVIAIIALYIDNLVIITHSDLLVETKRILS